MAKVQELPVAVEFVTADGRPAEVDALDALSSAFNALMTAARSASPDVQLSALAVANRSAQVMAGVAHMIRAVTGEDGDL